MIRNYLIWSWEHEAWWAPRRRGYTRELREAGLYTHEEAAEIVVEHVPPGEEVAVRFSARLPEDYRPPSYGG